METVVKAVSVSQTETISKAQLDSKNEPAFEELAENVDRAIEIVNALDADEKRKALALKDAIEAFHKHALTKIVKRLKEDARGKELLFELVDDTSVYALFQLHGIVKANLETRITRVLDSVRPYMQSHGGDVEFVRFETGTAFVRLHGACNGCSQSAVTLREGVEEALITNIPEVKSVEVVPNEPSPALIQIESLAAAKTKGWVDTVNIEDVPAGKMICFEANGQSILIVNVDNRLSAYRNQCVHQGLPLDGGMLDAENCTLTCPWHGFRFDAISGECLTAPQAQLEVFPLRVENGKVCVRIEG